MKKSEKQTDLIFHALANQSRRQMLDLLKQEPGCNVNRVSEQFQMSRIGVMKHIKVLVDAGLIISRKDGRSRELFFNAAPLQLIYDRWTNEYAAFWATQVVDLKYQAEIAVAKSQKRKSQKSKKPLKSKETNGKKKQNKRSKTKQSSKKRVA